MKLNHALIIGGSNGIGLAVALEILKSANQVTIIDKSKPSFQLPSNCHFEEQDLIYSDFKWLQKYQNSDFLFYSAGFGRVAHFDKLSQKEIENSFLVNSVAPFKILNFFMPQLKGINPFYCGVMVSIAGRIASPLFSVYSATKAALFRGIESINTELELSGSSNRILEISPGSIKGTSFNGNSTNLNLLSSLASEVISKMFDHSEIFIPEYEEIYKGVLERYHNSSNEFAKDSYKYKIENNRLQEDRKPLIGYLSGTFDLFHIGHLNLLKRAKKHCDYLVVGVHKDASHKGKETFIPFEERKEILKSIKYVDEVIDSEPEDLDIYTKGIVPYNRLFVGSDYKGTDRFNRYEEYFKNKNVKIIYFPYTKGTSSTQIRSAVSDN